MNMSSTFLRTASVAGVAALSALTVTSCVHGTAKAEPDSPAKAPVSLSAKKTESAQWGYRGADGPSHWGEIEKDFKECETGHKQSPVDLDKADPLKSRTGVTINYKPTTAELENNGRTVQGNVPPGNKITIAGSSYELKQFHFHLPSEHTVNGAGTAMEMHFVHENKKGKIAVVGVLLKEKAGKSSFGTLWKKIPTTKGSKTKITRPIDLNRFLPAQHDEYRYTGSLTTPPCTEGVLWTILKHPSWISTKETAEYRELFSKNNRPVQPLDGRKVSVFEG